MKELLMFAGTTEGRKLSEFLAEAKVSHTVCVATEYGEIVLTPHSLVNVHRGRMSREEIEMFLKSGRYMAVIDATHPYARDITCNIKEAVKQIGFQGIKLPYLRLKRENAEKSGKEKSGRIVYFETNERCVEALERTEGNILLTIGSKELSKYCSSKWIKDRLYVRVLPGMESLSCCMEQGICGKQIIAMQGPFSVQMNEAILRQYKISCLVTKESGITGGYPEKLEAAEKTGAQVFVIGRGKEEEGYSFSEICGELEKICKRKFGERDPLEIVLAGIGMGHECGLTKEVQEAVKRADILLGAERMLERFSSGPEKKPFYQAKQIIPYLQEIQRKNLFRERRRVVVLFSGDSGFYSGCQSLYAALEKEIKENRLRASLRMMPGISSVAYLASCIGESYQDAAVYSLHGKELCNLVRRIRSHPKTFLLTSGVRDVNYLGRALAEAGMSGCEIVTGYQLSYENQRIESYTPSECCKLREEGLYTCFVKNPKAINKRLTHGISDSQFLRERVPMTKEEVREVSICKLRLCEGAVVYDIGSGTGSVAVEIAGLSDDIQVYAVEKKKEALALIEKNKEKFHLQNIKIIEAEAPEGLSLLPAATHAFIGGSGGNLKGILSALRQINPGMRIVINAVSIETICEIKEILSTYWIQGEEIVQLRADKVKKAGNYHLMQAGNPIWIFAFDLRTGEQDEA